MSIDWGGTDEEMIAAMARYAKAVIGAVEQVALYFAPILETAAKTNAAWTDQTGNARSALHGYVDDAVPSTFAAEGSVAYLGGKLAEDIVTLYLSHGMIYGRHLETMRAGAYSIIWPTIEEHMPQVEAMLKGIFGR